MAGAGVTSDRGAHEYRVSKTGPRFVASSDRLHPVTTTSFMDRLGQSWDRRHTPGEGTEPLTVQSTVEISKPVQEVWDFATSPHSTVLVDHHHVCSIPVPGTPEGVGEQTCSLRREGNGRLDATVWEVVEYEPPHRYVVKTLTGPSESVAVVVISATPSGCTYTSSVGMRVAYGTSRKLAPVAQRAIDESTAKVRSFVESGIRLETVKDSRESADGAGEPEATSKADDSSQHA
jgi:Polyketide cyclase / dehydrase and lipid transport